MQSEASLEQLRAGHRSGLTLYAILMRPTERWEKRTDEDLRQHLLWLRDLEQRDVLFLSGPLDREAGSGEGLCVIRSASREDARQIADGEPFQKAGYRKNEVHSWRVNEGSVTLRMRLFSGTQEVL